MAHVLIAQPLARETLRMIMPGQPHGLYPMPYKILHLPSRKQWLPPAFGNCPLQTQKLSCNHNGDPGNKNQPNHKSRRLQAKNPSASSGKVLPSLNLETVGQMTLYPYGLSFSRQDFAGKILKKASLAFLGSFLKEILVKIH